MIDVQFPKLREQGGQARGGLLPLGVPSRRSRDSAHRFTARAGELSAGQPASFSVVNLCGAIVALGAVLFSPHCAMRPSCGPNLLQQCGEVAV